MTKTKDKTPLEQVTELLSQDMSKMDPEGRAGVMNNVLKLVVEMTEITIKAQITPDGPVISTQDIREKKESAIIT